MPSYNYTAFSHEIIDNWRINLFSDSKFEGSSKVRSTTSVLTRTESTSGEAATTKILNNKILNTIQRNNIVQEPTATEPTTSQSTNEELQTYGTVSNKCA